MKTSALTVRGDSPLARFKEIGWRVSAKHNTVLAELVRLDIASPWPEIFEPKSPSAVLGQIYHACQAFSRAKLTVRSFDEWVTATAQRTGRAPTKSAYHRAVGRLNINRDEAELLLDCLFSRWGLLPRETKKSESMPHGWVDASGDTYFGLPVSNLDSVRDRILAELFPLIEAASATFRIDQTARIVVGRYNVILGPPRGWALQAFHSWASEQLLTSHGTLIFLIDLGQLKPGDQHDFHAFYNLIEVNAAVLTLALFKNEGSEARGRSAIPLERGKPAWAFAANSVGGRPSEKPAVWEQLKNRVAFSIHGLPDQFKRELLETAKRKFVGPSGESSHADRVVSEALTADFGISVDHIFPRAYGVGLANTLDAARLNDADFLAMNVWIEQEANDQANSSSTSSRINVTHSFLWTRPDQRGRLTATEEVAGWWDTPERYAGATDRRPFQEPGCDVAFSMVQQAAMLRISENQTSLDQEHGLRSLAYLSDRLNLSILTLEEFAQLPFDLYRKYATS